jgi:hypothetical protein
MLARADPAFDGSVILSQGFERKTFIAVGDGSFCNKTTFRQPLDRTILITRARKDYDSVFPTRVKALAIMVPSSSVPKRSIMTLPSPGKRPKSFTALNTARFA